MFHQGINPIYDSMELHHEYSNKLDKTDEGQKILEYLKNEHRVNELEGTMIARGGNAQSFNLRTMAMWYLWAIDEYGNDQAKRYLNLFLDNNEIYVINTLYIMGIKVAEPIELIDNYKIIPIEELPYSSDRERYLKHTAGISSAGHQLIPFSAIIFPFNHKKIVTEKSPHIDKWDKFLKSNQRLHDIAFLINLLNGHSCLPYYLTTTAKLSIPYGPFHGSGGSTQIYDAWGVGDSILDSHLKPDITKIISSFDKLSESNQKRFIRVLKRLALAKRRTQYEDKILDLGIALEMLLLEDNSNLDQLSFSFRVRGAWLLGSNGSERYKIYKDLKDIYDYRSKVAHTGRLQNKLVEKIREKFPEYQKYAENICRKILIDGVPDWTRLILNNYD